MRGDRVIAQDGVARVEQVAQAEHAERVAKEIGGVPMVGDLTKEADWVAEGVNPNAKCTITVGGKEWVDILNGKLNPQMAFMSNKLKVQGDMGLAMKLQTLIQAVIGPPKKV
jgi:putative sterol carrier protein